MRAPHPAVLQAWGPRQWGYRPCRARAWARRQTATTLGSARANSDATRSRRGWAVAGRDRAPDRVGRDIARRSRWARPHALSRTRDSVAAADAAAPSSGAVG